MRDPLTAQVLGAAIEVHRVLGPGLLESTYEACLAYELAARDLDCRRQVLLPLRYKDLALEHAYRVDLLVEEKVIVEVKTVDSLMPVHRAQVLTYLRIGGWRVGLLLNFHVPVLKDGVVRLVNDINVAAPATDGGGSSSCR